VQRANILFSVEDTGIGISPGILKGLANPFVQADNSISRKFGGSGLGLYISKNLLKLMDSNFLIETELGKGSSFKFALHLSVGTSQLKSSNGINPHLASLTEVFKNVIPHLRDKNLVVVEDDFVNQTVISGYLKTANINFSLVDNGEDCLNLVHSAPGKFDGILMDVHMPVMNGLEATEKLRRMNIKIPIIALTAGVTDDERIDCVKCGMDDILIKPIDPVNLAKVLNRHFRQVEKH